MARSMKLAEQTEFRIRIRDEKSIQMVFITVLWLTLEHMHLKVWRAANR